MSMKSKFGASEIRINMLDTCVPLEYPVNVYRDVYDSCQAVEYDTLAELAEAGNWEEMEKFIEEHLHLINSSKLRHRHDTCDDSNDKNDDDNNNKTFMWTPLHWAASNGSAGVEVISRLLHFGALKSLKTGLGETAHDIGVRRGRSSEILELLELPPTIVDNKEAIENIEETVHKIIEERVGEKLKETGEQLPQLAVLWEMSNECGESMLYPVYGMRGGFSLDLDHEDNSVTMVGWSRSDGEGGGEVRHNIDSDGNVQVVYI